MKDLHERLKVLRADAADCAYIASVTADREKRDLFAILAANISELAKQVEDLISADVAKRECEERYRDADTRSHTAFQSRQT
jgi:hypothetical protein